MYHVSMILQMILWDIVTQLLTKNGKKKGVHIFLFWNWRNKRHNAKIGVLEDLEIKIFLPTQPWWALFWKFSKKKKKVSPLKISSLWQICANKHFFYIDIIVKQNFRNSDILEIWHHSEFCENRQFHLKI